MHRTSTIFNGVLAEQVTTLRYGEYIVIADAGLPIPSGAETLDLALTRGIPSVEDVLRVLKDNLVVLEVVVADQMATQNADTYQMVGGLFNRDVVRSVDHLEIESMLTSAKLIVQTGEVTPYGNVVVIGGLDFFDISMAE